VREVAAAEAAPLCGIFILGGFGGCACDIAETIGLVEPRNVARMADWTGRIAFGSFDVTSLNNNLLA
jgi:hypothetical protein